MIAVHSYHENNKNNENSNDKYPETAVEKEMARSINEMIGKEKENNKEITQLEKVYKKKKLLENIKEVSKQIGIFSFHAAGIFLIRYLSYKIYPNP